MLDLGEPYPNAFVSLAMPATRADGTEAVLKIQFPHRESEHEAEALDAWAGEGAVRLLEHDPERSALLIERCTPGTPLSELDPERALDVVIELLPRLWKPAAAPFRPLADEARWWASSVPEHWERAGRPFERQLMDEALDAIAALSGSQGRQVLVNQDMHADNVLGATREPWLVIDPKPLAGEREFGVAALIRGGELGEDRTDVLHRLDRLTRELGLDRDRARRWCLAQTLAWALDEGEVLEGHVEIARWLAAPA
jgi:streptomycin 6-kinase